MSRRKKDPDKPSRQSTRLPDYDYTEKGAYFVTVCTLKHECIFGSVKNSRMRLNPFGETAARCWKSITAHFENVASDEFIVMPNHVHGILTIKTNIMDGRSMLRPYSPKKCNNVAADREIAPGSLPAAVRSFKSAAARGINMLRSTPGKHVWQRNYHEHVIRNEKSLNSIREYIINNPHQWELDKYNPCNRP